MKKIDINDYNYPLPDERIAKFPLAERSRSKLLHYHNGVIEERKFAEIGELLPSGAMLVFNNTKVIRARIIMHKPTGARVEIFCLEPHSPADYERAFAERGACEWCCIVGNLKKWKEGYVEINFSHDGSDYSLRAYMVKRGEGQEHIVRFEWSSQESFGELLELLGRIPIPPYLNRDAEEVDYTRYQTVYSKFEGSVAAPTAGLHFSTDIIDELSQRGVSFEEVTLHVGAGTFLPVKVDDATQHAMHTEHFSVGLSTLEALRAKIGNIVAVGTTSVRTLESLTALAYRVEVGGDAELSRAVGQWELYDIPHSFDGERALDVLIDYMRKGGMERLNGATQIMITPLGYKFRVVKYIITNFHQPCSTLLLLVSAYVGEAWREVYNFALDRDFRFLSYGDSSLLMVD